MKQLNLIDLFNGINIAGIVIGCCLFILLTTSRHGFRGKWILYWLAVIILHQLYFLFSINDILRPDSLINIIGFPLAMVHLPLFYFNIREMTNRHISTRISFFHLLPYLVYAAFLSYYQLNGNEVAVRNGFLYFPGSNVFVLTSLNGVPIALSGVLYVALSFIELKKYKAALTGYYSFTEGIDLKWVKHLVIFLSLLFLTIFILIELSVRVSGFSKHGFKYVSMVLTFFTAYYGFRYYKQLEKVYAYSFKKERIKYQKSSLPKAEMAEIEAQIIDAMQNERLFMDEELSLGKLSDHIKVPTQKISETLNSHINKTFYSLVNDFRIEAAKELLKTPESDKFSIEGLAFECGFKSGSTFFRLFKENTGMTPLTYKNS